MNTRKSTANTQYKYEHTSGLHNWKSFDACLHESTLHERELVACFDFIRLCKRAHVWKWGGLFCTPKLIIRQQGRLNASTNYLTPVVHLTDYDLTHLSHSDVQALLAHEIGHLVRQHAKQCKRYDCPKLQFGVRDASILLSAVPSIILMKLSLYFFSAWTTSILTPFIILLSAIACVNAIPVHTTRRDEHQADTVGMSLVGLDAMVHLMKTCMKHEGRSHDEIVQCVKDMWTCPWACLKCIVLLLTFDAKIWLDKIGLSGHPAYRNRIKHMKKVNQEATK